MFQPARESDGKEHFLWEIRRPCEYHHRWLAIDCTTVLVSTQADRLPLSFARSHSKLAATPYMVKAHTHLSTLSRKLAQAHSALPVRTLLLPSHLLTTLGCLLARVSNQIPYNKERLPSRATSEFSTRYAYRGLNWRDRRGSNPRPPT